MERSWTPIEKGNIYCSPACGAGCTKTQYEIARNRAEKLADMCQKQVGGVWETHVWENLGWFYSVTLKGGDITIYPAVAENKYTVHGFKGGTPVQVSIGKVDSNLKSLVDEQLEAIKAEVKKWNDYLDRQLKAFANENL